MECGPTVLTRSDDGNDLQGVVAMIRVCTDRDLSAIHAIINASAQAYRGVIPCDCWREPYMSFESLAREIDDGVIFWGLERTGELLGVMGIQDRTTVTLIRHAYVSPRERRNGIGTELLRHLSLLSDAPFLVGTWGDASWAIDFYRKNGYHLLAREEKDRLLERFWSVPARQARASVVLADTRWLEMSAANSK